MRILNLDKEKHPVNRESYIQFMLLGKGAKPAFVTADYLGAFAHLSCKARASFVCLHEWRH